MSCSTPGHLESAGCIARENPSAEMSPGDAGHQDHPGSFGRGRWLRLSVGLVASIVFLVLAVQGVDYQRMWEVLKSVRIELMIPALGCALAAHCLRALRWGVLLGERIGALFRHLFCSMMIGALSNNLLPARLGELVRVFVLYRVAGISKTTSAATVILERITDLLALLSLLGFLSFVMVLPAVVSAGGRAALAGTAVITVFLVLFFLKSGFLERIVGRLGERWGLGLRFRGIVRRFADGLKILRDFRQLFLTMGFTAGIWMLEAVCVALVMQSVGLTLPFNSALLTVSLLSLSFAIPAAPGSVGTYEFFVVLSLKPFDVDPSLAIGLGLVLHGFSFGLSSVIGAASLWRESLSLRWVVSGARAESGPLPERTPASAAE